MNKYIQDWLEIIENMNNDNTYKLAWGRAIIEIAMSLKIVEENNLIKFEMIAYKMIKYFLRFKAKCKLKKATCPSPTSGITHKSI